MIIFEPVNSICSGPKGGECGFYNVKAVCSCCDRILSEKHSDDLREAIANVVYEVVERFEGKAGENRVYIVLGWKNVG